MNLPQLFLISLLLLPQPSTEGQVNFGKSECSYCRMIIDKKQFGGELETLSGKIFVFDAIECLAASYYREWSAPKREIKAIHFVNYAKPGTLLEQSRAFFVKTGSVESPMGMNFIAFSTRSAAAKMKTAAGDSLMTWKEVVQYVKGYWGGPAPASGG